MAQRTGRERTTGAYHLDLLQDIELTEYGMPVLESCATVPDALIGFNEARTAKTTACGIHFFIDDYQFERVWNRLGSASDVLARFQCLLTPDFSLYTDMPDPMLRWNCYRSRLVGAYWQRLGYQVIPTLQWGVPGSYEYCFDGLPCHSIVAVSTVGTLNDRNAVRLWTAGFEEAMSRIEPSLVLLYGSPLPGYTISVPCIRYPHRMAERFKRLPRKVR